MKVIIPAAGLGSRLRPHTYTMPKALLPVAGKPIIGHILDQVIYWGGDKINIVVGHYGDQIEKYVSANYDVDVEFTVQERMLGLGHAVLTGLNQDDTQVLVILGDTILDADLKPVIKRGITSIGVKAVSDPRKLGVVVVEEGRVRRLVEKPVNPPSNLAIVGVYYIRDGALLSKAIAEIIEKDITVKGEFQITDALQRLIDWGEPFETFPVEGWYDCGRPETLLETNRFLFDHRPIASVKPDPKQGFVVQPSAVGKDTVIERSIIGPYASIGEGSVIRDSVIRNCIIGDHVNITSMLLEDTIITHKVDVSGKFNKLNLGTSSRLEL